MLDRTGNLNVSFAEHVDNHAALRKGGEASCPTELRIWTSRSLSM